MQLKQLMQLIKIKKINNAILFLNELNKESKSKESIITEAHRHEVKC